MNYSEFEDYLPPEVVEQANFDPHDQVNIYALNLRLGWLDNISNHDPLTSPHDLTNATINSLVRATADQISQALKESVIKHQPTLWSTYIDHGILTVSETDNQLIISSNVPQNPSKVKYPAYNVEYDDFRLKLGSNQTKMVQELLKNNGNWTPLNFLANAIEPPATLTQVRSITGLNNRQQAKGRTPVRIESKKIISDAKKRVVAYRITPDSNISTVLLDKDNPTVISSFQLSPEELIQQHRIERTL